MARKNLINDMDAVDFRTYLNENFIEVYNGITAQIIKTNYESNPDTNEFTDAEKLKLTNLTDLTDAEIKTKYENNIDTNAFTNAEKSKLNDLSVGLDLLNITSNTILNGSNDLYLVDCTAGDITVTLPLAVDVNKMTIIKRIDNTVNTLSIITSNSETIDDVTTVPLNGLESLSVVSNNIDKFYII